MKAPRTVEVPVGGGFVGLLDFILEAQSGHQGPGSRRVVQVAVRPLLDGEAFGALGLDVSADPVGSLQNQHVQTSGNLGGTVLQVKSRGKAGDSTTDDDDAFHDPALSHPVPGSKVPESGPGIWTRDPAPGCLRPSD